MLAAALLASFIGAVAGHKGTLREVTAVPNLDDLGLPAPGATGGPCACCFAPSLIAVLDNGRVAALAAPSLPPLFAHALSLVLEARREPDDGHGHGRLDQATTASGDGILSRGSDLDFATLAVLLINPGVHVAWALRKRLLLSGATDGVGELWATAIVLSAHPKGGLPFAHRSWVHATVGLRGHLSDDLAVCEAAAHAHPRNYYAWTHRLRTARILSRCLPAVQPAGQHLAVGLTSKHRGTAEGDVQTEDDTVLEERVLAGELDASTAYVSVHPGDHCALHYRAALVELLARAPGAVPAAVAERELCLADRLTMTYEGHEALWRYRRRALAWAVSAASGDAVGRIVASDARFAKDRLQLASKTLKEMADHSAPGSLQDRAIERWEMERRHAANHERHLSLRYGLQG